MEVTLIGAESAIKKLDELQQWGALKTFLDELSLIAQREAKAEVPRDTAALGRSIQRDVMPFSAKIYTNLSYAPVVEDGRGAEKKMPPPQLLAGWARRHGKPQSALFVMARAIGKRGIKGRFFMRAAEHKANAEVPRLVKELAQRVEKIWGGK